MYTVVLKQRRNVKLGKTENKIGGNREKE